MCYVCRKDIRKGEFSLGFHEDKNGRTDINMKSRMLIFASTFGTFPGHPVRNVRSVTCTGRIQRMKRYKRQQPRQEKNTSWRIQN